MRRFISVSLYINIRLVYHDSMNQYASQLSIAPSANVQVPEGRFLNGWSFEFVVFHASQPCLIIVNASWPCGILLYILDCEVGAILNILVLVQLS